MTLFVGEFETIADAWLAALKQTHEASDGKAVNLIVTVTDPTAVPSDELTAVVDEALAAKKCHPVRTVANTIFPKRLYTDPGMAWSPGLAAADAAKVTKAAEDFYGRFRLMMPTLLTEKANGAGTYFSRIVAWPGKDPDTGLNQLDRRIHYLREANKRGAREHSASDIAVEGGGLDEEAPNLIGLQEYAATDDRQIAFPCLVHISMTVHEGKLSLSAVYRHWFLITRGFGNLIGLARLQQFVAQQSGYEVGELMVTATKGNAEHKEHGGRRGVSALIAASKSALALESQPA